VIALDDLSTGSERNVHHLEDRKDFRLVHGSVLDPGLMDDLAQECDVIVHLAAAVGVHLIVTQPLRSLRTNIRGTEIVFDAADKYKKKVFLASTSEVYGKASGKMHELSDRVLGPATVARWSYSASKAIDEHLALAYAREHGLPVVIARFFNTVGPRQSGAYGMVIPRLVSQALIGRELTVYGDGTQTRCFCDVDDVIRAVTGLLEEPDAVGEVFNVGSEEEVTIRELAERIIRATGSGAEIRFVPYDEVYGDQYEDMLRRVPDTRKVRELLKWAPAHDLDSIIKRTVAYTLEVGPEHVLGGGGL
jgi:UDP-glucose 4-epimerase